MNPPRVFLRMDASPEIGLGHLRRCSVLAEGLKARGARVDFFLRFHSLAMEQLRLPRDINLHPIPWDSSPLEDAETTVALCQELGCWVGVVDHYRLESEYQQTIRDAGLRWMQFGNPIHQWPISGDLVHDAAPGADSQRYSARCINPDSKFLCGPRFALVAADFRGGDSDPNSRSILLTFGGGDDRGATLCALDFLDRIGVRGTRVVLATTNNPNLPAIRARVNLGGAGETVLHVDEWNPAPIMKQCGIAICAGGTTLQELACLGIPALIFSIAKNQIPSAEAWERTGMGINFGSVDAMGLECAAQRLIAILDDPVRRGVMSATCRREFDGMGSDRVAAALYELAETTVSNSESQMRRE